MTASPFSSTLRPMSGGDRVEGEAEEDPGRAAERRGDEEGRGDDPVHVHPEDPRGARALRHRPDLRPSRVWLTSQVRTRNSRSATAMIVSCRRETTPPRTWSCFSGSVPKGNRETFGPQRLERHRLEHRRHRERADEPRDVRVGAAAQRPERDPFEDEPEQPGDHDGDGQRHEDGNVGRPDERQRHEGREHEHRGVGEVQDVEDAEDERVAEREQRVDAAEEQSVDDLLAHARLRRIGATGRSGTSRPSRPGAPARGCRPGCRGTRTSRAGWGGPSPS